MSETANPGGKPLELSGEFTIFTALEMKARLVEAIHNTNTKDIEVDLSNVTDIDSAGLQLMVMAKREAASCDKVLHLVGHSEAVLELIDLCDLGGFFGDPVLIRSHA